ncbi:ankyrin repeat domain-containing protein [Pasteurella multocida]|uniref:ankyrin repeat domain-containing protein n=1 Tax=Pasteurella multocida TaxID=747 RepID=UPI000DF86DE3|nr:ankyrin repeat domain-containing protein [Pasteurella multocida]MDY0502792.1 ankyrin repeat domain-containing protein [Pasteurella multocida]MDY0635342.1 ankyrin repeat domain-containing protein [Pasteurella multocida]MDY0693431.1 ankyrin repeat domain-containing protein [Pasteurella multocida]SUB38064.1 Ankyrin repeats (3 copies) [Pasteurella multocida]HDR0636005.1 ankyrin repeat domain-containing protein [Pasteurella multocida]
MDTKLSVGVQILEALDEDDFATLDAIFQGGQRDVLEITPSEHWNWLHKALLGFDPNKPSEKAINYLINKGVAINAQDMYGMTPLHYAMRARNIDAAMALLHAGADPNIPNRDNLIPLRTCIRYPDRLDLLALMLEKGGNVHYFDGNMELLDAIKDFKGNDPNCADFIAKLEEYA